MREHRNNTTGKTVVSKTAEAAMLEPLSCHRLLERGEALPDLLEGEHGATVQRLGDLCHLALLLASLEVEESASIPRPELNFREGLLFGAPPRRQETAKPPTGPGMRLPRARRNPA